MNMSLILVDAPLNVDLFLTDIINIDATDIGRCETFGCGNCTKRECGQIRVSVKGSLVPDGTQKPERHRGGYFLTQLHFYHALIYSY